ncbi:MAG TPA: [LysW]-lysine hydrolase [Candidatus Limnocylindrales bacterium]|nr:[LysW]-lysine hydrolase [Candidatus Limnocylindrales bacterium]
MSPAPPPEGLEPADLELVRGLVAIPSLSRHEGEAVRWLVARMAERGFRASVDQAGNAVGEIGDGARHVVLLGHIDTVPGEIPVRVEAGELIGRGAVDAKGPLAAFVAAASERVRGVRVTVVGAVEEESPTSTGARYRATLPAPDWCVVGEPSGWDAVTVAYKGRLALRVALERPARHGAAPGATCTEEALALWQAILGAARARTPEGRAFDRLDCRLEGIAGGESDGIVERAELRLGYRIPPGIASAEVEAEARAIAGAHAGEARAAVERVAAEEPARTSRTSPLARAFVAGIAAAGGSATFTVKSGTSDMNVLAPAWRCPMVAYGPGDSAYDHTPMERLSLADYARAIRVVRGVLRRAASG